jgi:esterase/lipase superfamily enzyme
VHAVNRTFAVLAAVALLAGCGQKLLPTPNLYVHAETDPFAEVPAAFQSNTVDVMFVTDRLPAGEKGGSVQYGYRRSPSTAWGSGVVEIGRNVSWPDLVAASRTAHRKAALPLRLESVTEHGRFPETPAPFVIEGGKLRETDEYVAAKQAALDAFHEALHRRLALTPRKEVFVFVHGYRNTFEDAVFRAAELWHFLGREGVPIAYSWPAGFPGLLRGYTRDRESGEYTIFHLKETLRALAACPEVERISVVAHSRGTDVLASALRELNLRVAGTGAAPTAGYKIHHVVLAAPDIDFGVARQRFGADQFYGIYDDLTIYVCSKDLALGTAEWLFQTPYRLGKLKPEQMDEAARQRMGTIRNGSVVDARIHTDLVAHEYFMDDPATFSDFILVLRYDRPPGAAHGRPLTEIAPHWYILDDDYPQQAAPLPKALQEK